MQRRMLASRIVFLVIGFGLGLTLGYQLQEEPASGRATPTRVVHEVVTVREPPPPVAAPQEAGTVAVAAQPLPDATAPSSALAEQEREDMAPGLGQLIVDFSETDWPEPRIHVEGRLLEGGRIRFKVEADDEGLAEVELLAGTHTISWPVEGENATGQRALNVAIREGWVTRVDVTDPNLPRLDPIGEGLGRLEISVADLGGGPLRDTEVRIWGREFHGGEQRLERPTNESGRVRFDVLPGRYLIEVGLRSEAAVVRVGEWTTLDVHYEQEGELVVQGPLPGAVGITAIGPGVQGRLSARRRGSGVPGWRFAYLPPGEYLVTYQNRNRAAGRATVRSRQVTHFAHDLPPGSLLLNIVLPESRKRRQIEVRVHDVATGFRVSQTSSYVRDGLSVRLGSLASGAYRIKITGRTFETHEEEVFVGADRVDRRIELVAKGP